jgi:hypothetical protein
MSILGYSLQPELLYPLCGLSLTIICRAVGHLTSQIKFWFPWNNSRTLAPIYLKFFLWVEVHQGRFLSKTSTAGCQVDILDFVFRIVTHRTVWQIDLKHFVGWAPLGEVKVPFKNQCRPKSKMATDLANGPVGISFT